MTSLKQKKQIYQDVTTGYQCDQTLCGNIVVIDSAQAAHWHHFDAGHQGWGSDSGESWDRYDVCCVDHYMMVIREIVERFEEYKDDACNIDSMSWYFAKSLSDIYLSKFNKGTGE